MPRPATSDSQQDWKPLVVCPNAPMALRIRSALSEQGLQDVCYVSEYPQVGVIGGLVARHGCNVCFLDIATSPEEALPLVSEAAAALPVVALNPRNDADLILRCLRRGAGEFLSEATVEQVGGVLERLARLHAPAVPPRTATVYCVMPGKAGCGASTLAAYLAVEMRRCDVAQVLLVDTDIVTGTIAFLLKLKSDFHFGDAARDWNRMDDDLWARLAVPYHGIDILPAPLNPAAKVELDRQAAFALVAFWRKHYDAIVLDLPGAHSAGFEFAAISDEILLVTTNELSAIHATRRSMECLERVSVESSRVKLVVTRYTPATGLKREDVKTALKMEPYALLSNDYDSVQEAALDGKPVAPGSYFGRSIRALAERLLGKEKTVKKRSPFLGFLSPRN